MWAKDSPDLSVCIVVYSSACDSVLAAARKLCLRMDMSTQQEYPGLKDGEISTGVSPPSLVESLNERAN